MFADAIAASLRPTDRRPIYDWAADRVSLTPPLTKTGPFDVGGSRHLCAPFDALRDDRIREVNVCAAVREGKTLLSDVWLAWLLDVQPGPTMLVFQNDKAAEDHAELRTWKMIEANPWMAAMLNPDRHQNRTCEIIFPRMPVHIVGPALSNLQSRGWQNIVVDEAWMQKNGKMEEIRGRLGDYVKMGTDKLLALSQGGELNSDWDEHFRRGALYEWEVQCAGCAKYMRPDRWTLRREDGSRWGMTWDKHKDGNGMWDIAKVLPTVRFECQHCGHPHIDGAKTKLEWNRTGRFVCDTNDSKRASYHWTAVISFPWEALVELYLQAVNAWRMGNTTPLVQFMQKRMALMVNDGSLSEELANYKRTQYEVTSEWTEEAARFMTVDRQADDLYWYLIRAWARNGKSRRIAFGKCFSAQELEEVRKLHKVNSNRVLIDSGYRPKGDHGVYAFCAHYGWIPTKGEAVGMGEPKSYTHALKHGRTVLRSYSEPRQCDPEMGKDRQGARYVQRVDFSAPTYADRVSNLQALELWEEPAGNSKDQIEVDYRKQMAAEFKRRVQVGTLKREKFVWVCPSGDNHAFDCSKMQALAAVLSDLLPDELGELAP